MCRRDATDDVDDARPSAAVLGTVLIGLAFVLATLLRATPEPVDARVVRLEGEGIAAGWYEADDLAAAARAAGGEAPLLASGPVEDGDVVRLVGGWALPDGERGSVESIALGRRVRLNRASQAELEALPGIGPKLAERILAGRPYASVDDLDRVKGIGPATVRKLRPLVAP